MKMNLPKAATILSNQDDSHDAILDAARQGYGMYQ